MPAKRTEERGGTRSDAPIVDRKAEHIRLALDPEMQFPIHAFDAYAFEHCALPEIDFREIDTSTTFLGKRLDAPLLVSCMTGGTADAARLNLHLAAGAEGGRVALGIGSQRKAIEDPSTTGSFEVRAAAPSVPLLANLGAVQLNYGFGLRECRRAIEMVDADALAFHLNPLQEALQPEGQTDFSALLAKMGRIAAELGKPVVVKEVGSGISAAIARRLLSHGIHIVDCAGLGGTNWALIEGARARDAELGELFSDWGIPTPRALEQLREIPGLTVIGSGGVRNGVDVAKALALGADLVGMAYPFLEAAEVSAEQVARKVERTVRELKVAMFCVGARSVEDLRTTRLERRETVKWPT